MKMLPLMLSAALLLGCDRKPVDNPEPPVPVDGPVATVYTTSVAKERFAESTLPLGKPEDVHFYKVERSGETFQEVDGFGLAITQASCYNLQTMPAEERTAFLTEIFSREKGLGSSLIRVCIGGSDFSMDEFTWCDEPGMENFAVHVLDEQWLFPVLDQIFKINPDVKIIGSPWSCPRWMKMSDNGGSYDKWTAGRLNPAHYQEYADYFVRWIKEMEKRGYPIYAITLQNEPLNRGNSMSLYMTWEEQRDFIKQAVGPAFRTAGIKTKILLFDHNYNYDDIASQQDYPIRILEDAEAAQYVAGSAWHNYGGKVSTLDRMHSAFPDKEIYFTEASIGSWGYSFDGNLIGDFRDIFLGTLGRYGKGVTLWNLMLDDQGKPYRPGGCSTCFGAVTLSSTDHKTITRNSHYYNVAHCSKVLQPGAVRLGTKGYESSGLTYQWYRNPDGSQALLLLNEGSSDAMVNFVTDKYSISCKVPAKAIQSIRWEE
ncbi:MAG: glycoside hydrolase family 30 protein [Bacteroidales bacterium]|nr:glycoside hydrolase family 30 protein [Bacteroidales bacterium]